MPNQHAIVTFAVSPSQSSDSWKQVLAALRSQLPLRNIHWKSASRPSIKTIQELEISLLSLDSLRDEHASQVPVTLLEKPLLNLYVVACEDNEIYRTTVKKQIKDWQTSVTQRKNQEWLIVHVVRPDAKIVDRKFFNMKGSVLDKMKADFNVDKRDRCVQLAWSVGDQNPAVWADLISKIKDGLLSALDTAVSSREEEVKRSEAQRHMPGWNFCTYFILKESLASSYEAVNLFEDALQQYNELEATFMQVLRDKNMSWFGSLIHPAPKDDSMPLLSISKKPYRDLILANTISVFDLRIYLLGRQSGLLNRMHQPTEICRRAIMFLSTFGRRLREVEPTLPEYFVESWIFSSALSVVDQCDKWASSWPDIEGVALARYSASKGELIELARSQLDILGIKVGHLPSQPPFSMALPGPMTLPQSPPMSNEKSPDQRISRYEFMLAIGEQEAFYDLYCTISNRAIDSYVKAGRRKFALKLHGSLAALDIHRGRLSNALTIFSSLPAHYAPHMWISLESFMLSRAIDTHAQLQRPRDREWIHILLAYLKTYVNDTSSDLLMSQEDLKEYATKLVNVLREGTERLDSDLVYLGHPAVSIRVASVARYSDDEDLLSLDATVHNYLPCDIVIDEVSVMLVGRDASRLKFSVNIDKLFPGKNDLILACPTSCYGVYVLDSSEIQMSRLHFQWKHKATTTSVPTRGHMPWLVRLPHDPQALNVQLRQPDQTELGVASRVLLVLSTKRNDIPMATISLAGPAGVNFDYASALMQSEGTGEIELSSNCINLVNAPKHSNVIVSVPHSDVSRIPAIKISIRTTYNTVMHPMISRTLQTSNTLTVALPIAVNVEDFFRGKRLFSKFTVSATTRQHVRISSVSLRVPPQGLRHVSISGCHQGRAVMTVTPERAVNYLFSVDSENGPVLEPLHLVIVYRVLREEVKALVHKAVEDVLAERSHENLQGREAVDILTNYLESDAGWVELYSITGELVIPSSLETIEELKEVFLSLQKALAKSRPITSSPCPWREIKIPVDVPRMDIIAAARIEVHASPFGCGGDVSPDEVPPIYAGQPISAMLSIRTSLHWAEQGSKRRQYSMRYDIEERVKDWLVCGRKRGEFTAWDGETFNVPLTLIALHHGELTLPKVHVRALPVVGDGTMESLVLPSTDSHQVHGAETILILPRGGRSTFIVGMGSQQ
ncbi:trafficking protein particle complex subunit 10 [Phlebopus sp. FC_14]|nr:trafficking protein particle complex subunit 10 [Phlebopus sp. FC_14]